MVTEAISVQTLSTRCATGDGGIDVHELITNEMIGTLHHFDPATVAAEARAYKR